MNLEALTCVDEFGNRHVTAKELGRGGQGAVFTTRDPDVVVKFALKDMVGGALLDDLQQLAAYRASLRRVRLLPIPRGLPLAGPLALLRDHSGYVMRLVDGMRSFESFFVDSKETNERTTEATSWLDRIPDGESRAKLRHYSATGGLRRRLGALSRCASVLARLHGAGLTYGDISLANAYVSADGRRVSLIDADNLRYASATPDLRAVISPGYGAPEVVRGEGARGFHADAHAFAVMAFSILSLIHPFRNGKAVQNAGEDDWDGEAGADGEEKALRGELPWVDDPDDDSNAAIGGIPRALLLTPQLKDLFQRCFGPGRTDPERRPGLPLWAEALERARDLTTECRCGMACFGQKFSQCPYCDAPLQPQLRCEAWDWPLRGSGPDWVVQREAPIQGGGTRLSERLFAPFSHEGNEDSRIALTARGEGFQLRLTESDERSPRLARLQGADGGIFQHLVNESLSREDLRRGVLIFTKGAPPRVTRLSLID